MMFYPYGPPNKPLQQQAPVTPQYLHPYYQSYPRQLQAQSQHQIETWALQRNQSESNHRTITVTGTATIGVQPDTVIIQLAVVTENESLATAQKENAENMNAVIQSLVNLGIPKDNIQTTTFNIFPRYDFVEGKQIFRGYEVLNEITVTITNIEQAGTVIDTAVRSGANRVSNIQFTKDNEQSYYQQALEDALENALQKARTIAEKLNLPLDSTPIKITEVISEPPVAYKTLAATSESFSTPIEPGQINISATTRVIFKY